MQHLGRIRLTVQVLAIFASLLCGCGGSGSSGGNGGGGGGTGGGGGSEVAISSITAPTQHFECGITNYPFQLSATVTGSSNTTVNWSISPAGSSGWSVTAAGILTPPTSCAATTKATITATAAADSTKSSTLTVWAGNYVVLQNNAIVVDTADGSNADDSSGASVTLLPSSQALPCTYPTWSYSHLHLLCEDFTQKDAVLNLFTVSSSGWGITLASSVDLTTSFGIGFLAYWKVSPDEKSVLLVGEQGTSYSVYSYPLTASAQTTLTPLFKLSSGGGTVLLGNIFYSPDGSRVTFYNSGAQQCWVMNADGSNPMQLVAGTCRDAMLGIDNKTVFYDDGNGNVYEDSSGTAQQLAAGGYSVYGISPDGEFLLLIGSSGAYRLNIQNHAISMIGPGGNASWYL